MMLRTASAMLRKIINTPKAPRALGAYNQAVIADKTMYVAGQLGLNPETLEFVSDNIEEQTKQALINMGHILEAGGSSFNKVVKTTVLLADINDFAKMNDVYKTFFTSHHPARAAYQVANLPKLAKVEIEAVAIVGEVKDE